MHSSHTFFIISFPLSYSVSILSLQFIYVFIITLVPFLSLSPIVHIVPFQNSVVHFFCLSASKRNLNYFLLNYLSFSATCSCHDIHTRIKMCNDNDSGCCSASCRPFPRLLKAEKVDSVYCVTVTICAACSRVVI